jgi:hypothetical protein
MSQTNTQAANSQSSNDHSPANYRETQKPSRQSFYRDVVLNTQGQPIDESVWKPVVGDITGRALAGRLRRNGMQIVHVFDKPAFESAKANYRSTVRQAKITERDSLIIGAFQKAGVPNEPHIERALKDLLPILEGTPASKAAVILKNVVKTVANGTGLKADPVPDSTTDAKADDDTQAASADPAASA